MALSAATSREEESQQAHIRLVMQAYGEYLIRLAYLYVKNWTTAEDVVQEVFITYYQKGNQLQNQDALKSYLAKIAINKCHDYLRSWKSKKQVFSHLLMGKIRSEEEAIEKQTLRRIEERQLAQTVLLSKVKYREVIILYYYHDFSILEIADLLDCSQNTVKTRLKRGRETLRSSMESIDWEEGEL